MTQLLNKYQLLAATLLFVFCFCGSTCKRIWKYPISMYGIWAANNHDCNFVLLEIKKNGEGDYGPLKTCGKGIHARGLVRYTDRAIFVGTARLELLKKPELSYANDSVRLNYHPPKNHSVMQHYSAKMTIQESAFRGNKSYTLYKIENY